MTWVGVQPQRARRTRLDGARVSARKFASGAIRRRAPRHECQLCIRGSLVLGAASRRSAPSMSCAPPWRHALDEDGSADGSGRDSRAPPATVAAKCGCVCTPLARPPPSLHRRPGRGGGLRTLQGTGGSVSPSPGPSSYVWKAATAAAAACTSRQASTPGQSLLIGALALFPWRCSRAAPPPFTPSKPGGRSPRSTVHGGGSWEPRRAPDLEK